MRRVEIVVIVAVVLFLLGAIDVTLSSAREWQVEGTGLSANEGFEGTTVSAGIVTELSGGTALEVVCEKGKGTGSLIPKTTGETSVTFTKCSVPSPASCRIEETIKTAALALSLLEGIGGTALLSFKPKAGSALVTIEVTGCSGEGDYEVKGKVGCNISNPLVSEERKNCTFEAAIDQELTFGAHAATLQSIFAIFLTGTNAGKKWSV